MSNNATATATSSGGISCLGILGIIFVLCKVFEYGPIAQWSWLWVLAPFWIGFAMFAAIMMVIGLVALGMALLNK